MKRPKVVFTAAVMDLLHEGHINLLQEMRSRGDITIVVLHDDASTFLNKGKVPIQSLDRRTSALISTGLVDIVKYTFSREPTREFANIVYGYGGWANLLFMRGDDWAAFPGRNVLESNMVPIEFVPYTLGISSTARKESLCSA